MKKNQQTFRKEVKALLKKLSEKPILGRDYSEAPEVISLLNKWVEDEDSDIDVETLETILEEEILKFSR